MQRRTLDQHLAALALVLAAAGCGGGGGDGSDAGAVANALETAADAVGDRDGDRACGYLTPDAQRQAMLQYGGGAQLGDVDCGTFVNRATLFLSPLERQRIKNLAARDVQVNGASASATLASEDAAQPMSVRVELQKLDGDWKISGFVSSEGVPGQ